MPALPTQGSTNWYPWAQGVDGAARDLSAFVVVLPTAAGGGGDDTTVLQAALNAAPAGARLVAQQGASYSVSTLTIGSRVSLDLTGATVTQRAGTTGDLLTISAAGTSVTGGTWDGNRTNQTATQNRGIRSSADDITITGVTVQNTTSTGIYNSGGNRFRVQRCKVTNSGYIGIFSEPNTAGPVAYAGVAIEDCHVDRSMIAAASITEGGIKIKGGSATTQLTRGRVRGCAVLMPTSPADGSAIAIEATYAPGVQVEGNHVTGGAMGVSVAACDRAVVASNPRIFGSASYGIEVAASKNAAVVGNTIDGNSLATTGIILDLASAISSDGTAISGNTIRGCTTISINVQSATHVVITGNTVDSIGGGSYLLQLSLADHATVSGNTLEGNAAASKGVMADSSSNLAISGNTIRNCTQNGVFLYSSAAGYTIQNVAVTGNTVTGIPATMDASVSNGAVVGGNIRVLGNAGIFDYPDFATRVTNFVGSGSPEGVWYAGPGSTFQRTDGGAGTTFYVKQSAVTLNTGWAGK